MSAFARYAISLLLVTLLFFSATSGMPTGVNDSIKIVGKAGQYLKDNALPEHTTTSTKSKWGAFLGRLNPFSWVSKWKTQDFSDSDSEEAAPSLPTKATQVDTQERSSKAETDAIKDLRRLLLLDAMGFETGAAGFVPDDCINDMGRH